MIEGGGGVGLFQMDRLIFIPPFVEFIYWNTELGVETGPCVLWRLFKLKRLFSVEVNALYVK